MIVELSVNGLNDYYKRLKKASEMLKKMKPKFIEKSLSYIQDKANEHIQTTTGNSSWYVLTHELENSWVINILEKSLINYCSHAAFVEYGTGSVGKGTHPDSGNYSYDVKGHGDEGWFFYDKEHNLHWTKGMEAHAFLFDAVNDYLYHGGFDTIINEVLNEVFGGL